MDFPYVDPKGDLAQGDVLKTSPELQKILSTYHPYYVENKENRFFVVLTQSCDLVRRRSGIGTRYLSLAPVRSAQQVIERQLKLLVDGEIEAEMPIGEERARARFEQFLSRLINNNEPDFFFLGQILPESFQKIIAPFSGWPSQSVLKSTTRPASRLDSSQLTTPFAQSLDG